MKKTREQIAIDAYLSLLKKKGVDEALRQKKSALLQHFANLLAGQSLDGNGYRDVVEAFLEDIPASEWPFVLETAREYFHFWVEDIKSIAQLNTANSFANSKQAWQPEPTTLENLTEQLKTEKFDAAEMWPLKSYKQALRNTGASKEFIDSRAQLAKITLMRLRASPEKNQKNYRVAVDSTLPLFSMKDTRQLFIHVVREFYYFWSGNPEAEKFLQATV